MITHSKKLDIVLSHPHLTATRLINTKPLAPNTTRHNGNPHKSLYRRCALPSLVLLNGVAAGMLRPAFVVPALIPMPAPAPVPTLVLVLVPVPILLGEGEVDDVGGGRSSTEASAHYRYLICVRHQMT